MADPNNWLGWVLSNSVLIPNESNAFISLGIINAVNGEPFIKAEPSYSGWPLDTPGSCCSKNHPQGKYSWSQSPFNTSESLGVTGTIRLPPFVPFGGLVSGSSSHISLTCVLKLLGGTAGPTGNTTWPKAFLPNMLPSLVGPPVKFVSLNVNGKAVL